MPHSFDQLETDGSLRSIGEETKKPLHDQGSYPTIDAKDSTSTESANRRRSTEDTREDDSSQIDSAPELDPSLLGEAVLPDGRRSLFLDQETKGKLSVKCKTIALSCADTSIRTTPVTPIPNIAPIVVQTITDVSRHDGIRCSPIVAPKKKHVQISVTDKELNGDHVVDVDQPDTFIDGETGLDGGHIHSFSHKDNRESDKRLHNESKEEHAGESDSENGEKRPGGHTAGCPVTRSAGDRSRLFSDASLSSTQEVEEHEELKEGNVAPAELVVTEDQEVSSGQLGGGWGRASCLRGLFLIHVRRLLVLVMRCVTCLFVRGELLFTCDGVRGGYLSRMMLGKEEGSRSSSVKDSSVVLSSMGEHARRCAFASGSEEVPGTLLLSCNGGISSSCRGRYSFSF